MSDDRTPEDRKTRPLHARILIGLAIGAAAGLFVNAVLGADTPAVVWVIRWAFFSSVA